MERHPSPKPETVSLDRALSKMGIASRSEARRLIWAGRVSVNGRTVRDTEARVRLGQDTLRVDGEQAKPAARHYIALNKPAGLVTTKSDERGRATVYECLRGLDVPWLGPVGRLDKASEGLLFFTNDTAWANRVLDPASHLPKTYHVQVKGHLAEEELEQLRKGVVLKDGALARVAEVRVLREGKVNCWLEIVLHGGLNRQIRRMLAVLGFEVLRLIRIAIGPIVLGDLPKGAARPLTPQELESIGRALAEGKEQPGGG